MVAERLFQPPAAIWPAHSWSELVADYEMFDVTDIDGVMVLRLRVRELDETKLQRLTQEFGKVAEEPQRRRFVSIW